MSSRALRNVFAAFLGAQVAILAAQHATFFSELFRFPSRLAGGLPAGSGSSVPYLVASLAVSALWAGRPWSWERFASAGLANLAAGGLTVYAAALVTGRLAAWLPWAVLALSAGLAAAAARAIRPAPSPARPVPLSPFDALSVLFLSTLLVPTVFPYVAFDANLIWAWRAYAMRDEGFARAVTEVVRPEYPPLDSILLWLGIRDPLFEGRLLPWLLLVLFAIFFRARLARIAPRLAAGGLLFLLATVHVWQGTATYYADVPLMVFAAAGSLLALGLPGGEAPPAFDRVAASLSLAAAVLVRPDGFVCVVVVGLAVLGWAPARIRTVTVPALVAALACVTWILRPASLRPPPGSYRFFAQAGEWRQAGATTADALAAIAVTYLHALQGQWLSHKGLGGAFWLVLVVAASRGLAGTTRGADPREDETRFYGAVSFLSLATVALTYAAIPFASNVRGAVAPDEFPTWLLAFRNFARVGMGRMVVHLVPYFVLYAVSAFAARSGREGSGTPC